MSIEFRKVVEQSTILNPMKDFAPETHTVEFRVDPLTGQKCFVGIAWIERGTKFPSALDEKQIDEIAEKTREGCFMCPENVERVTPKYPPEVLPEGRLHGVEAILFPNMLAISKYSAVVAVKSHYLKLTEYPPDILSDAFIVALRFIKRIHEVDPLAGYAAIGCNSLFPAGGSATHPHLHVFIDEVPFNHVENLLQSSKRYFDEHATNYWDDLIKAEKREGERYIGSIGNIDWLAPFAPSGHQEIQAIIRDKSNFIECAEDDMRALAQGLSKVLKYYAEHGIVCFNFLIYSAPLGESLEYFRLGLKIVPRFTFGSNVSDISWRQRLGERGELYTEPPETVANLLRKEFQM
jgi:galactose-1-phosphate uridylyltransferase